MDGSSSTRSTDPEPLQNASPTLPPMALEAITAPRPEDAPRRCFICLTDEDHTDPPGSWVDPCPCTLEAHQDCMLSWVTDCERSNKPLKCPVCKSAIEMEGPWDPIVAINDTLRKRFTKASPFVLFTSVSMGIQFSMQMYGAMALWSFSGKDALLRFMLGPDLVIDGRGADGLRFAKERIWNALILMNVAPALLGGQLLPGLSNKIFLPTASFYGIYHILHDDYFFSWPPSPQLAMAVFPYIRSAYHSIWRELVLPYEINLNRQILGLPAVEPRANNAGGINRRNPDRNADVGIVGFLQNLLDALDPDDEEQVAEEVQPQVRLEHGEGDAEQGDDEGGVMVEVVIEEIIDDGDEAFQRHEVPGEEEQAPGVEAGQVPAADGVIPQNHHQHDDQDHDDVPALEEEPQPHHEAPPAPPARRLGLGAILSNMSNAIVSALILPGISFAMGEALRLVLPKTWTSTMNRNLWLRYSTVHRPGLLQQQWGRSLVGGCLYVVLKDAVRVYSKSRKVAAMKNRRVKNVERQRRKK